MAALSVRLHIIAFLVIPTTRLSERVSVRMSLDVGWDQFYHLSQHQRDVAEHMTQGLDDQALANMLSCSPEQHVPQLEQFKKFVLG